MRRLTLPNLDGLSDTTRIRIQSIPRDRYMEVFGYAVSALDRVAYIAKPFPVYQSLPGFSIEIQQ